MATVAEDIQNGNSADTQAPSSSFDLLREINDSQGQVLNNKPAAPAPSTKEPDSPAPAGDDNKPAQPKPTSQQREPMEDPVFVRPVDDGSQQTDEPEGDQKTSDQPDGTEPQAADHSKLYTRLSELTEGTIEDEQSFRDLVTRYNELETQAAEGFKPKFRDENHRRAYEMLANVPKGKEVETARRTLHALSLEPDKLKGKDLLFEAFLLDPDNSDLSRERAGKLFDLDFNERFENASENELVARALEKEERKAKELIEKTQSEFMQQAQEATHETPVNPKIAEDIAAAIKGFAGIELSFAENAPEIDRLKIKIENPADLEAIQHYAQNPNDWFKDLISEHRDDKGNFDMQGWVRTLYELHNHRMLQRRAYDHGIEIGKRQQLNKDRNSTPPAEAVLQRARVPAGGKKEPASFADAFGEAMAKNGHRR